MKKLLLSAAVLLVLLTLHGTIMAQAIPDPAVFIGSAGEIFEKNTDYNGISYDAYVYSRPVSEQDFINAYTSAAINAGYTVEKTRIEGYPALTISAQFQKNPALLLYDYQDNMMFLVPTDIIFVLQNPDTVSAIDPLYLDMISYVTKYLGDTKSKAVGSDEIDYGLSQAFEEAYYDRDKVQNFGYCFMDIDGDGIDEMIFGSTVTSHYTAGTEIYDLFTIRNGSLIHLASGFYRANYHLCSNGEIVFHGSSSAFDGQTVYYSLRNGELALTRNIYYVTDPDMNGGSYYISRISDDYVFWDSPQHPADAAQISESEVLNISNSCKQVTLTLQPFYK